MSLKLKKTIAREFVILIISTLFALISFLGFKQLEINNQQKITFKSEKLKTLQHSGVQSLIKDFYAKYDKSNYSEEKAIGISHKFKNNYRALIIEFYDKYEPKRFSESKYLEIIDFYNLDNPEYATLTSKEKKQLSNKLNTEIKALKSIDHSNYNLLTIIVMLSIIYPLRFIIYSMKWSIKTLKR